MPNPVGRPRNIESPERMWELFEAYRKDVKSKPFKVKDWVGKDGYQIEREKEKPLTIEGFENYCRRIVGDIVNYLYTDYYPEFASIWRTIKLEIRQDQIEGGMAQMYSSSITQRLNGLKEITDNTTTHNVHILNIDPLDDSADKGTA